MSELRPQTLRIGWVGFHEEGREAFRGLLEHAYRIEGVVTLVQDELRKRSGWIDYTDICSRYGIPVLRVRNINDAEAVSWLRSLDLDLLLVIGWSQILKSDVLALPRIGTIGAHASLLPALRGSAPVNWAIIHGLVRTGNSLIVLSDKLDGGRVLDQEGFDITPFDTCKTLYEKVAHTNKTMLLRVLPKIATGEMPGFDQEDTTQPNLPRRGPEDGRIVWRESARGIYDLIRAVAEPYPGAFFYLQGAKVTVWHACVQQGEFGGPAGKVVGPTYASLPQACGQTIICGDRKGLVLLDLEFESGERLSGFELASRNWVGRILE